MIAPILLGAGYLWAPSFPFAHINRIAERGCSRQLQGFRCSRFPETWLLLDTGWYLTAHLVR